MMNVLFINTVERNGWGGPETWMRGMAAELQKRGHRVFLGGKKDGKFLRRCAEQALFTLPLKSRKKYLSIFDWIKLIRFCQKEQINIIIANYTRDVCRAGIAKLFVRGSVVLGYNGNPVLPEKCWYRRLYKSLTDGVITNLDTVKDQYSAYEWIETNFVKLVRNGIDVNLPIGFESEAIRKKYTLPKQRPVIGCFGRLIKEKQHKIFLEVAKEILADWPEALFLIVGEGPGRQEIQQYAVELGIFDNLYFLGFQEQVMALYAFCDIVLYTASGENFPNVVMEAMLAEKPVVAFNTGGVSGLLPSEGCGIVVPPNDIYMMIKRLRELLKQPELQVEMGKKARQYILQYFSIDKVTDEVESYLRELHYSKVHKKKNYKLSKYQEPAEGKIT